ncbi:58 kDa phosphoprotein-like [Thrips palmi]|uniref:58 kDa phosphoprotein-like n=1 Tax=Thrips palmi TaxID=161013 RepID=A0A6P8ZSY4_THRPL|nr:58 kDa phosphoprotein-like [Thrips palmi]XP_034248363.1 58 kDa phosphoprotein-like [Thrips palmi]
MVSPMTALAVSAAALLCAVLASPVPSDDGRDASASAPSNFLSCANGVGSGNGFNNCTMPAAPSGVPSMPSGVPSMPSGVPSMPGGVPSMPSQPPSINQGVDCATAVGQGNGFNNCSNIFQPAGGSSRMED